MAESKYIVFERTGEVRKLYAGELGIGSTGIPFVNCESETIYKYPVIRPVDPARVTVAPEPEAYTVTGDVGVAFGGNRVFVANTRTDALAACRELNRLHRELAAAKGGA